MIPTPAASPLRALGLAIVLLLRRSTDASARPSFHPTFRSWTPKASVCWSPACHIDYAPAAPVTTPPLSRATASTPTSACPRSQTPLVRLRSPLGHRRWLLWPVESPTYRYLSPKGDPVLDLITPEWLQRFTRHAGGGPAVRNRDGQDLSALTPSAEDPETAIFSAQTGQMQAWDWQSSGTVEMNCFLCHIPQSNNEARSRRSLPETLPGPIRHPARHGPRRARREWRTYQLQAFDADGSMLPDT